MTAASESSPRPIALFDMKAQQALIRGELDRRIASVLDSGRFVQGPEVDELEKQLAAFAGCRHAVGVSSGTDALQIAMMAEGIGRGDAVFLPAFTYTATAEVPLVLGATPVFVDVDPRSFNIDIADLKRRIATVKAEGKLRPRAVVGVDLFGLPADWPAIEAICAEEGMFALDDAAQAFGALRVRAASPQVTVGGLSGGNQQKVLLSRWLETHPQVLILDEPTRGVDIGAKSEMYRIVDELAQRDIGIIVISSELPEIIGICDRVLVMREGRIAGEVRGPDITQEAIIAHATGAH